LWKLQLYVSRSWSFAFEVPKLELGNQHNQHIVIGTPAGMTVLYRLP
jgi:hypothetical protein